MANIKEKLNILDFLQLVWFDYLIKSAAKKNKRCVYSDFKARKRVSDRLEKVGYNVYVFRSGTTNIRW